MPPPGSTSLWARFREDEWPTLRELLSGTRVSGCYLLPLLICCVPGLLLLFAYPVARSARTQSRRKFPSELHRRIHDPQVWKVQRTRAWIALAASLLILTAYGTDQDWAEVQDQYLLRLAITPWLLLLTAPLVIVLLFRLAPSAARPGMRSRLRRPVRMVLWYFGAFTLVPVMFALVMAVGDYFQGKPWSPFLSLALLYPVLWMLCFVGFGSPTMVRTAFGTSEVHAALPALLTGVLVWELAVINLVTAGMPPGPPLIQILAVFCGPLSVTAVAYWEIDRLRVRHGVRLRG
ncbi:hypothetical protein [Streptomyces sp. NPDC005805]|uniref:hypothetical protein n=1 Tax=Streptomyces sp. NPDC005805 TaxID=3157068 RepID=UPI0033FDD8BB